MRCKSGLHRICNDMKRNICLSSLFTSYSNLYCFLNWCVIDEDKITTTAGACDFVAFDSILVFVDGLLYVG